MYSVVYFLLMLLIGFLLGTNRKKLGFDGAYSGIMVGFFISYALVPFMFQTFSKFYLSQTSWKYWYIKDLIFGDDIHDWNIILAIVCVLIGIMGFNLGYKKTVYIGKHELFRVNSTINTYDDFLPNNIRIFKKVAIALLMICSALLLLYIRALGGVSAAFMLSNSLRSHTVNVSNYGISGIYSYVFLICGLLPLSFALLWSVHSREKQFGSLLLLTISAVVTFIYLRLNSGKSGFIRFGIIISYLMCGKKLRKHYWWYVLLGGIFLLPVLEVLDVWFSGDLLSNSTVNYDILGNVVAFESPTELNYNLVEITNKYGYQFFKHYILDFIDILPGVSFKTSWEGVSEFVRGADWMNKGGTPNDLITYGFLQFNVVGVFIHLFIIGQLASFVDRCVNNIDDSVKNVIAICFCASFISLVTCADIASTFLHNLFFTGLLVFIIYLNHRWGKGKNR